MSRSFKSIILIITLFLVYVSFFSPILGNTSNDEVIPIKSDPLYYFLGSSVTYGAFNYNVSFVDYMQESYPEWSCVKEAKSGTTLVDTDEVSYIKRMETSIPKDAVIDNFICQLSTNDATQDFPLGEVTQDFDIESFDTSTIIGSVEYIIAYVNQTWDCPVTFYTNPRFNNSKYEDMIDALYQLQDKWGIGIIDFYNYKNMDALSEETLISYMKPDMIHPIEAGHRWMAEVISEYLISTAEISAVENLIRQLPDKIELATQDSVALARAGYDALNEAQKTAVAPELVQKLEGAKTDLEYLFQRKAMTLKFTIYGGAFIVAALVVLTIVLKTRKKTQSK